MKSGDDAVQSPPHTKPIIIVRNPALPGSDADDEVECSKCHMYFGLRGAIEAHEKRHAAHADEELFRFQHPEDYSSKPVEVKVDQFRKQRGLELAVKKEVMEQSESAETATDAGVVGSGPVLSGVTEKTLTPKTSQDGTGTAPSGDT